MAFFVSTAAAKSEGIKGGELREEVSDVVRSEIILIAIDRQGIFSTACAWYCVFGGASLLG